MTSSSGGSRRIIPRIVVILVLSVLFLMLYREMAEWPYFEARKIVVNGNHRILEAEVLVQAGIEVGTNLISINLAAARKRLLAHPWIEEAQVEWQVPSTVVIDIREQQPLAVFEIDQWYTVNVDGRIFKIWDGTEPEGLPVVEGLKFSDLGISGASHSIPFNTVMNVLTSEKISDSVIPNEAIQRVLVDRELGLTLLIAPNEKMHYIKEINLGYEDYPHKYGRLRDLLTYLEHHQDGVMIHSVNLSNPDRIVIAPVHAESVDENDVNEDGKEEV